jgi:hypothetical protein
MFYGRSVAVAIALLDSSHAGDEVSYIENILYIYSEI